MWNRKQLKETAKLELKNNYWTSYAVCLVGTVLGGSGVGNWGTGGSAGTSSSSSSRSGSGDSWYTASGGTLEGLLQNLSTGAGDATEVGTNPPWMLAPRLYPQFFIILFLVLFLGLLLYIVFVANPLSVGISTYFVRAPYGERRFSLLFSSFRRGRYGGIVQTQLVTGLCLLGWYLLLIVPGIIKSYEYRLIPYIIGEQPQMSPQQARRYSRELTMGHKFDLFVLDLSFIGWSLLVGLSLMVVLIPVSIALYLFGFPEIIMMVLAILLMVLCAVFVNNFLATYREAVWAQLYLTLRAGMSQPSSPPSPYGGAAPYGGGPYGGYSQPGPYGADGHPGYGPPDSGEGPRLY